VPLIRLAVLVLVATLAARPAIAEEPYPNRPIHVVVPYAAGGVIDVVARIAVEHMATTLKQPMVVDNKPGAGSIIGLAAVAKAPADGYTILVNGPAQSVVPSLFPQSGIDVAKDFAPVSILGRVPFIVAVNPSLPASDLKSFVAYLKANPDKVDFGSTGIGSTAHLSSELFRQMAEVDFVHVPYRGTPAVVTDLLAGRLGFMIDAQNLLAPHVKSGDMRALAVTTPRRSTLLPELPTLDEAGLKGYDSSSWQGMYVPAKAPKNVVETLVAAAEAALADPAVRARYAQLGIEPPEDVGPANLSRYLAREMAKWNPIIVAAGIKPE
jgi:tripartite-type tricarboxylate transporter receptor subunit TctC